MADELQARNVPGDVVDEMRLLMAPAQESQPALEDEST